MSENLVRVAIIGECMAELQKTADHTFHQSFGGDTYNTAVYLKKLFQSDNKKLEVSYITGIGENCPFSAEFSELLKKNDIDTSHITKHKNNLGVYIINVDSKGERTFTYWRDTAPAKYCLERYSDEELEALLSTFNYVYLSGVTLAILSEKSRSVLFQALKYIKSKTKTKVLFDNNYRPRLWESLEKAQETYRKVLSFTDIAFLTYDDECALWGYSESDELCQECIDKTSGFGVSEIIIKRGSEPCYGTLIDNKGLNAPPLTRVIVKANKVTNVVDTTAAGDSFSGGYLSKRLSGLDIATSIAFAHKVASTVIQYKGAIIPDNAISKLRETAKDFKAEEEQIIQNK